MENNNYDFGTVELLDHSVNFYATFGGKLSLLCASILNSNWHEMAAKRCNDATHPHYRQLCCSCRSSDQIKNSNRYVWECGVVDDHVANEIMAQRTSNLKQNEFIYAFGLNVFRCSFRRRAKCDKLNRRRSLQLYLHYYLQRRSHVCCRLCIAFMAFS